MRIQNNLYARLSKDRKLQSFVVLLLLNGNLTHAPTWGSNPGCGWRTPSHLPPQCESKLLQSHMSSEIELVAASLVCIFVITFQ